MGKVSCGCGLCIALLALVPIIFIGSLGSYLAWTMSSADPPQLSVDEASVINNSHLTSTFDVHVTAYNPNAHFVIHYYSLTASVYHNNGTLLAYEVLPNDVVFTNQPKTNVTMKLGLVAHNVSMMGHETRPTAVEVRVRAMMRVVLKGWKKGELFFKAYCSPLPLNFNSSSDEATKNHHTPCRLIY